MQSDCSIISNVVLIMQIVILIIQLFMQKWSYDHARRSERGVFFLKRKGDGINHPSFQINYFDLDNASRRYLVLILNNSGVVVRGTEISINNVIRKQRIVDTNNIFSLTELDGQMYIDLPLIDGDLNGKNIDCKIVLYLQTFSKLNYSEILDLRFKKEDNQSYWLLDKYIPSFKDGD